MSKYDALLKRLDAIENRFKPKNAILFMEGKVTSQGEFKGMTKAEVEAVDPDATMIEIIFVAA